MNRQKRGTESLESVYQFEQNYRFKNIRKNGAGYKTTENNNGFRVVFLYLDLLQTWGKGCVQKMFGKTLCFSYFYFFIR